MSVIHKYEIKIEYEQTINMPFNAEILCLQVQDKTPYIWVKCNITGKNEDRFFRLCITGGEIADNHIKYIGTFQVANDTFVGHVFELN